VELKTSPRGKWVFKGAQEQSFKVVSLKAMKFLYNRIVKQNRDSKGRSLPPLSKSSDWFFFSNQDPRFKSMRGKTGKGKRRKKKKVQTQFVKGGYSRLKEFLGKRGRRDGNLTGEMWRGLTPQIKKLSKRQGGGLALRLYFGRGSSRPRKVRVVYDIETREKKLLLEKEYIRNRTKAFYLQVPSRGGRQPKGSMSISARPTFELMAFNETEMKVLLKILMDQFKLNEKRLIDG